MILYVPLYGAIIYKDYGQGYKAILKSILWMLFPVVIAFRLPHLPLAVLLLFSLAAVLTVAIAQGGVQVPKKKTIGCLWGGILGIPVIGLNLLWKCGLLLSYIFSSYGLILGAVVCSILTVPILKIFVVSFEPKNQLGRCMGCGCGMVILLNFLYSVGLNIGRFPLTQSFLPFFSAGGNNIIVSYILLGIVLSIYRYKNIYPTEISTKLKTVKIRIQL